MSGSLLQQYGNCMAYNLFSKRLYETTCIKCNKTNEAWIQVNVLCPSIHSAATIGPIPPDLSPNVYSHPTYYPLKYLQSFLYISAACLHSQELTHNVEAPSMVSSLWTSVRDDFKWLLSSNVDHRERSDEELSSTPCFIRKLRWKSWLKQTDLKECRDCIHS